MKIFKIILIVLLVSWIISYSMVIPPITEISEAIAQVFPPFGLIFMYLYFFSFWVDPPILFLLAPFSFPLLAFLNARKSGSKIWYGVSIASFIALCFYFYPVANILLTPTKDILDIPDVDF